MKWLLPILFSIILGYSYLWIPYYVKIFHSDSLVLLGDLKQYSDKCSQKTDESVCTHSYKIPHKYIEGYSWLGAGVIISSTKYFCEESPEKYTTFDNPNSPGRGFDIFTTYQTIDLSVLNCKKNLIIESWSRHGSVRNGHQEGALVTGSYLAIERVKKLYEFVLRDIPRILVFLFLCLIVLYKVVRNFFKQTFNTDYFSRFLSYWLLFAFFTSDLFQIILPITQFPTFFNRLSALFSLLAHFLPILLCIESSLGQESKIKKYLEKIYSPIYLSKHMSVSPLMIFIASLVFSKYFALGFVVTSFSLTALLFISSIKQINQDVFTFSIIVLLMTLKILNIPYLPNTMTSSYFVGCYIFLSFLQRLKNLSTLSDKILGISYLGEKDESTLVNKLEKEIVNLLDAGVVSILSLGDAGGCQIKQYRKINNDIEVSVFERETVPPIMGYVISSQKTIWNVSEDEEIIQQIMSKAATRHKYDSKYFSATPIKYGSQIIGALSFTNYDEKKFFNRHFNEDLKLYLELALKSYVEYLIREKMKKNNKYLEKSKVISNKIEGINPNVPDDSFFLQNALEIINEELDTFGFIGKLDNNSKKIKIFSINGYSKDIESRYLNGNIYALEENRHGPLPLAINEQKNVVIPDVELWKDLLHEYTNYFFKINGTKSCVAIPIFNKFENIDGTILTGDVWGAVFLEKATLPRLTNQMSEVFDAVSVSISSLISKMNLQKTYSETVEAFSGFIPKKHLQNVIKNHDYEERDFGYLIMLDLAGSTKIVNIYNRQYWEKFAENLKNIMSERGKLFGLVLQEYKWDGFIFTLSASNQSDVLTNQIILFIEEIKEIIDKEYSKNFKRNPDFLIPETPKLRMCFTYGDISRGINNGPIKSWAIMGAEIANVTKLEAACKEIQKKNPYTTIFCDSSINEIASNQLWQDSKVKVPSNDRAIFFLKRSWSELTRTQKKAA